MRPHAQPLFVSALVLAMTGVLGCNGDDENVPDPPQQTGDTAPVEPTADTGESTGDPFQVRDHEGSVVLYRDGALRDGDDGYYRLYGLFGSDLRGIRTGQFCLDRGVCIHELPENIGDFVEIDGFFRTTESDFDWVGERVSIGNNPRDWMEMAFQYTRGTSADPDVPREEFGFYVGNEDRLDRDEIPPLGVRIEEGEWGDNVEIEAEDGIPLPFLPRIDSPAGGQLTPAAVVTFNWSWPPDPKPPEPPVERGSTPLYLRVRANELHRIYRLPQEGPFDLELGALGLNDSSSLEVFLGRWSESEARLNRNDLYALGGIERRLAAPQCPSSSFPNTNLTGESTGLPDPAIQIASLGVSFDGLITSGEIEDYRWDSKGKGLVPTSASLTFTAYDADNEPLCTVVYDASRATSIPANQVQAQNAARLFGAFEIDLANGISDCNRLDAPVFEGYPALPLALESTDWIFALGEIGDSAGPLQEEYGDAYDEVETKVYGLYAQRLVSDTVDRCPDADEVYLDIEVAAVEVGAGVVYQTESCGVLDPNLVSLDYRPGLPMKSGVYHMDPLLPFSTTLPQCPPPETTTGL